MGPGVQAPASGIEFGEFEIIVGSVSQGNGKRAFPVFVSRSPCGAATGIFEFDLTDQKILDLTTRAIDPTDDAGRQLLGSLLYTTLFVPAVRDVLVSSIQWRRAQPNRGLRIRLWIDDAELACLPWELLMDDSNSFLAASANMSVVRYLPTPEPPASEPTDRLKVLIIFSSPTGAEVKIEELQKLQATLATFGSKMDVTVLNTPTGVAIASALQDNYHVVHYLGHGGSECLYVADDEGKRNALGAVECAQIFAGHTLPLLVLNACHSANAEDVSSGLFAGVAPAIVRKEVAAVIAMQYEFVTTDAAARFNQAFYGAVLKGHPIDQAVNDARQSLAVALTLSNRAWSTPVLYLSTRSVHVLPILSEGQDKAGFQAGMLTERIQGSPAAKAALVELANQVKRIEQQVSSYRRSRNLMLDIERLWNAFVQCRVMLDNASFLTPEQRQEVATRWVEFKQGTFTTARATAKQMNDPGMDGAPDLVDKITADLRGGNFGDLAVDTDQLATKLGTWRSDRISAVEDLLNDLNAVIAEAKAFLPEVN